MENFRFVSFTKIISRQCIILSQSLICYIPSYVTRLFIYLYLLSSYVYDSKCEKENKEVLLCFLDYLQESFFQVINRTA